MQSCAIDLMEMLHSLALMIPSRSPQILSPLLFNGGSVVEYLKLVKVFLDANPHEVITFIFTNPEMVSVSEVWKPAFDSAGITPMAYVPPSLPVSRGDWPTLGDMISADKRVVVFLDKGANGTAGDPVDFILPQFDMVWEDPYSSTNEDFPCRVDRIYGSLSVEDHANMINHNLNTNLIPIGNGILISDRADARTTNSIHSIMAHANGCAPYAGGNAPNFVLLDYVNVGHGREAITAFKDSHVMQKFIRPFCGVSKPLEKSVAAVAEEITMLPGG
ncbi:hypothetical protein H0H92_005162 [Tricholoma furcatifolium]|nr:hypothetical protein H0H92_005162 [Tricholoma furcatifolium]